MPQGFIGWGNNLKKRTKKAPRGNAVYKFRKEKIMEENEKTPVEEIK